MLHLQMKHSWFKPHCPQTVKLPSNGLGGCLPVVLGVGWAFGSQRGGW